MSNVIMMLLLNEVAVFYASKRRCAENQPAAVQLASLEPGHVAAARAGLLGKDMMLQLGLGHLL